MTEKPNNLKLKFDKFKRDKKDQIKKVMIGVGIGAAVTYAVVTRNIRQDQETLNHDNQVIFDNQVEILRLMEKNDMINNIVIKR